MTKRGANVFELIFATFLILKLTNTGIVSEWSWWAVILPLILNFVVKFFEWIFDVLNLKRSATVALQNAYYDRVRDNAVKKARKDLGI